MWAKWPEAVIHLWTVLGVSGYPSLATGAEAVAGRFVHMPESVRDEYNAGHESTSTDTHFVDGGSGAYPAGRH